MGKESKQRGKYAGILLTVVLVVCCVALFLLSEQGRKVVGSFGSGDTAALAASETEQSVGMDKERFISSAVRNGLVVKLKELDSTERIATYKLENYGNCEGELILSLSDNIVTAFTVRFVLPYYDDSTEAEEQSAALQLLSERDKQAYNDYLAWFSEIYAPLAFALDEAGELTFAHMDATKNNLKHELGESAPFTEIEGAYKQYISLCDNDGMCEVSVSLERTPAKKK